MVTLKATSTMPVLIRIVSTTIPAVPKNPREFTARPTADSTVAVIAADPSTSSSIRLRTRERIGSGRLLRGTAHTESIAFCTATPTPEPP